MTATFKIICKTDSYHASRFPNFNREGIRIEEEHLSLEDANKELLNILNREKDMFFDTWKEAEAFSEKYDYEFECSRWNDGTRGFNYDIFSYRVEKED